MAGVTGLPRSTQNAAIARMYVHDWIRDRYIPNPSVSGWTWVTFAIALPYADKVTVTARGWGDQEGAALLWSSQRTLFGVFFSRTSAEREGLRRILSDRSAAPATIVLQQDLNKAPTPVYIDFEAAWSRVARTEWTVAYPQSLPRRNRPDPTHPPPSPRELISMQRLVTLPFLGSPTTRLGRRFGLPYRNLDLRCLRKGLVEFRSFLNPVALAKEVVEFPKNVAFVHGTLRSGAKAEGLFRELVELGGASPFLFCTDGVSMLLGGLSTGHQPAGSPFATRGEVVMSIFKKHLESIVIVEDYLPDISVAVDHRYDRLMPT